MTSAYLWKGLGLSVFVAAVIVFCFIGLSPAQSGSQGQLALEKALLDALPKDEDLPGGIEWDKPNYRPEFFDIDWAGHRISQQCPSQTDNFYVYGSITYFDNNYKSPDAFRSKMTSTYNRGVTKHYEKLPGGVIWEDKHIVDWEGTTPYNQAFEFEIDYWKSPSISGSVRFNIILADCEPPTPQIQADAEAFARSECERLAEQVYDRLPGDSSTEYDPLITLLADYIPDPWGIYKTSDKDVLISALKKHDIEPDGATFILLTQLLPWHENFQKEINQNIDCGDDFYSATSSWADILPVILGLPNKFSDLIPLPAPVEFLKRASETGEKSAEILRDQQNEEAFRDAYRNYREYREGQSVYEDASALQNFQKIWPSNRFVGRELTPEEYKSLLKSFEAKYRCEKKKEAIQKLEDNERAIVSAKIQEFSSDLRKIEGTFEALLKEKRASQ